MEKQDYSREMRKHGSATVRVFLVIAGSVFVVLGVIGAFMPVLPTTPFLLLAAACYARASTRFYNFLLNNRTFGPTIREWQRHRSIPWRTKIYSIALMTLTLSSSIIFFVRDPRLQVALTAFGVLLAIYMYRIPSRDRPVRSR
jgi:uncharacterized membrane protein YbaN (DUF454 family)